jgi:hypothetical protein
VSHYHHGGSHQGAIIDGGLSQESMEIGSPLHHDHCVAQNKEYPTNQDVVNPTDQDVVNALDIIAKVAQLEVALSLSLHLVRTPLGEAFH